MKHITIFLKYLKNIYYVPLYLHVRLASPIKVHVIINCHLSLNSVTY